MPNRVMKPYNIVTNDEDNSASINLYGEVVSTRPVDWWTGEPGGGDYIAVDEFLRDLDDLGTRDNITVHINSVGGDLYAGIAIYNRLKSLSANVVTVNDGLAASAGSIIFQAGNTRKVHAGSNIMVHQAAGFLYGYYQSKDLKEAIKQLDAGNKAAVNIYAEASGREPDAMKAMVDKETWLTGQEAVDAGLADEVIDSGEPISMSLSADKSFVIVNGVSLPTRGMNNIPKGIPVLPAANVSFAGALKGKPAEDKNTIEERGTENKMEIKNIEEMRAAFPEILAQAETEARNAGLAAGIAQERARIQGIEAIEGAIADKALITDAKYGENALTAEQLAFKAMQAQAAIGVTVMAGIAADNQASGVDGVGSVPNSGAEEGLEPVDVAAEIADVVKIVNAIKGGKSK